eukprot:1332229-Prymnesium_polylepis.1
MQVQHCVRLALLIYFHTAVARAWMYTRRSNATLGPCSLAARKYVWIEAVAREALKPHDRLHLCERKAAHVRCPQKNSTKRGILFGSTPMESVIAAELCGELRATTALCEVGVRSREGFERKRPL